MELKDMVDPITTVIVVIIILIILGLSIRIVNQYESVLFSVLVRSLELRNRDCE